jgi:pentatricopeptide repeat protein
VEASPKLVEEVLMRFENAGMQAYRFFEWAGKQQDYAHSVEAYHIIIDSLGKIQQYGLMWTVVNLMKIKGVLTKETFAIIMRRYARAKKIEEAVYTFDTMEKFGVPPDLEAFNSLLSALCKCKKVHKAQEIFDLMKVRFKPDLKTYSIFLLIFRTTLGFSMSFDLFNAGSLQGVVTSLIDCKSVQVGH